MSHYKLIRILLEINLANSASRRGTSAHRLGFVPQAISDHLPIRAVIQQNNVSTTITSWNMLADVHLYNNFMNITGSNFLLAALSKENIYGGKEDNNKLYHYFSELGQFLYDKRASEKLIILDKALLEQFNSLQQQGSLLARSRDATVAKEKTLQAERARAEIAAVLLNKDHPSAHEFQLAIQHSVDLIYHIQHESGVLKWCNRFKQLKAHPELVNNIANTDFLCLQECTSPEDMQSLLPNKHCLVHKVNPTTTDHCVLFYDAAKYKIIGQPLLSALDEGKKPCIIARFKNIEHGKEIIVGSIHHPGGKLHVVQDIVDKMNTLKLTPDENIECYLPGDYNHAEQFFLDKTPAGYQLHYPYLGTMAGADYGNTNRSIDAMLTNVAEDELKIVRIPDLPLAVPSELPIRVHFKDETTYRPSANSPLGLPVQRIVTTKEVHNTMEVLGKNEATYAARITF